MDEYELNYKIFEERVGEAWIVGAWVGEWEELGVKMPNPFYAGERVHVMEMNKQDDIYLISKFNESGNYEIHKRYLELVPPYLESEPMPKVA